MFSFFQKNNNEYDDDDDTLIEKDFLNKYSKNIIGSVPLKKNAFYLKDTSSYQLIDKKSYICYEEYSENCVDRQSFRVNYYRCKINKSNYYLECNNVIYPKNEGTMTISFFDELDEKINTKFKFKLNNNIANLNDIILIQNNNFEIILFLARKSEEDSFYIEKIQIFN